MVKINPIYLKEDFGRAFNDAFVSGEGFDYAETGAKLLSFPFPVATLPDFLVETDSIVSEILRLRSFKHKLNDLHDFYQSKDLGKSKNLCVDVKRLVKLIKSEMMVDLLSNLTSIKLDNDPVDISAQIYKPGGRLLCHDDALEGRRIAFVLYLVDKDWNEENGGFLELFSACKEGHPVKIEKFVVPKRNMLMFFEVSPVSFHQVGEVMGSLDRISVAGWFHGPEKIDRNSFLESWRYLVSSPSQEVKIDSYLDMDIRLIYRGERMLVSMVKAFKNQGFLKLENFFELDSDCKKVIEEFGKTHVAVGPPNYRHVAELPVSVAMENVMDFVGGFCNFRSVETHMFLCGPGDYCLIHDDYQNQSRGVDVLWFFCVGDGSWNAEYGGSWRYVISDRKKDEVLEIEPDHNSLFMIKRDVNTQVCMDYIKKSAMDSDAYYIVFICKFVSE